MQTRRPKASKRDAEASHRDKLTVEASHPKTGAALPHPIELDPVVMPIRGNDTDDVHRPLDGFYTYVPVDLRRAAPIPVAQGMSSTNRWKALHDRIKATEQANSCPMVASSIGGGVGGDTDGGSPQPPEPFSGSVVGGGVWSYLFRRRGSTESAKHALRLPTSARGCTGSDRRVQHVTGVLAARATERYLE